MNTGRAITWTAVAFAVVILLCVFFGLFNSGPEVETHWVKMETTPGTLLSYTAGTSYNGQNIDATGPQLFIYEDGKDNQVVIKDMFNDFHTKSDSSIAYISFNKEPFNKCILYFILSDDKVYKNVIISNTDLIINKVKTSKIMTLKADLYDTGIKRIEFNTMNFDKSMTK